MAGVAAAALLFVLGDALAYRQILQTRAFVDVQAHVGGRWRWGGTEQAVEHEVTSLDGRSAGRIRRGGEVAAQGEEATARRAGGGDALPALGGSRADAVVL